VNVVDDEDAYMSLEYNESKYTYYINGTNSTERTYFTAGNQFAGNSGDSVTVTVSPSVIQGNSGDITVEAQKEAKSLAVGERKDFKIGIECNQRFNGTRHVTISFDVAVDGDDVAVQANATDGLRTVEFDVDCPDPMAATSDSDSDDEDGDSDSDEDDDSDSDEDDDSDSDEDDDSDSDGDDDADEDSDCDEED
jgi:hypothetical protein